MKINLKNLSWVELDGPNWATYGFGLTFHGQTPTGKELSVRVEFPPYGVDELAPKLHEALQKQEKFLANSRTALKGE